MKEVDQDSDSHLKQIAELANYPEFNCSIQVKFGSARRRCRPSFCPKLLVYKNKEELHGGNVQKSDRYGL